jgi:hypothetical protein
MVFGVMLTSMTGFYWLNMPLGWFWYRVLYNKGMADSNMIYNLRSIFLSVILP